VFGWSPDEDGLVEVHCFFSDRYLVTVRRDDAPALDELCRRYAQGIELGSPIRSLYRVIDGLGRQLLSRARRLRRAAG
jgi:magnesium transporter